MAQDVLENIISDFNPIGLKEMDGVELMNRTDTKFLVPLKTLLQILEEMKSQYRVLEVKGVRLSHYETLYYDTSDFHFYTRHHNGKKNRWKIRKRSYIDSNLSFLELKFKTNRGRTQKQRTVIPSIADDLNIEENAFIDRKTGLPIELQPQLKNTFTRVTLVEPKLPERITIDLDLAFEWNHKSQALPQVVIVEVKQESANRRSPFVNALKKYLVRPESMSKYCLGIALLVPGIKRNTFKEKLLKLKKFEPTITL
ncbi:MAG: polyphosphate polymerase domain-containing protein [Bacteroidota bacterium]|jgi:VTC domain